MITSLPSKHFTRRFAITDIHGCFYTFRRLVEKRIGFQKTDALFLLGDYINKGPYGAKVLAYILNLQQEGYSLFCLRGNHEDDLINWISTNNRRQKYAQRWFKSRRGRPYTDESGWLRPDFEQFLRQLPYAFELEDFFLVHAGFNFESETPFNDTHAMVWLSESRLRRNQTPPALLKGKTILKGHTPTGISQINEAIAAKNWFIPLDNGCVYALKKRMPPRLPQDIGNLCAFDLDRWELLVEPCLEE